jgi:NTE family protein
LEPINGLSVKFVLCVLPPPTVWLLMRQDTHSPSSMLKDLLSKPFALAMAPGFFRIYAHVGVMETLYQAHLFDVRCAAGSSAGAMSAGFLCSGLTPTEMIDKILRIKRPDIWDAEPDTMRLGLLKGELLQDIFETSMPLGTFEECAIPCGMTALDLLSMETKVLTTGSLATNMRASCCFPILFAPVYIKGRPHIDGGGWDRNGVVGIPSLPDDDTKLLVNIVFERQDCSDHYSMLPEALRQAGATLLTIVVNGLVFCGPHNMDETGPASYRGAKRAMQKALVQGCHLVMYGAKHYVCVIDASDDGDDERSEKTGAVGDNKMPSRSQLKRKRSRSSMAANQ